MLGYPAGTVNGFPGNRETQTANPAIADELRLNYNVPPSLVQNPLGVLAGDFAGFPNGGALPTIRLIFCSNYRAA